MPETPLRRVKAYTYAKCSTCRDAAQWLKSRGIAFEELPIRETPPPVSELQTMLAAHGGNLKRLFNTSGRDYREGKIGDKLPGLSVDEALALLSTHGNLVKRPFVLGLGVALVGFDESAWDKAFAARGK